MRFPYHHITTSPCHCISQSFAFPPAIKPVSHLTCPLPPNQSVIWLALYHRITASLHHHITTSPHYCVTTSPCHHISQSFDLPPATKPVSHLTCPLPPNQSVIWLALYHCITASLHHHITTSPHYCVTASPCHHISQSFDLPPATKPVSHLTCPLPPNHSVIWLALYHCITASLHHRITTSPHYCVTASPCHHISQSFALPPTTKPASHLLCPCHQTSQSFDLPSTTASPYHCVTTSLHEISLPPCHRITASLCHCITAWDFPTTVSPHHFVTASPHHCITVWDFSPPHWYESVWLMLPSTVLICLLTLPQPIRSSEFSNLINIKSWFFSHHLFEKVTWSQNRWISWL